MTGKLYIVGVGPGHHDHMTFRAKQVITESDTIVGYETYVNLVQDLIRGKTIHRYAMTQEVERAHQCIDLAKSGINVMMISQNPSESSITIVVKNTDLDKAVSALEMDLLGKIIKKLEVTTGVSIIALIGSGMRGTIGIASKVFTAIEKNKINISMITQGSSELNLALVVKNSDTNSAVRAIHDAFTLDKIN